MKLKSFCCDPTKLHVKNKPRHTPMTELPWVSPLYQLLQLITSQPDYTFCPQPAVFTDIYGQTSRYFLKVESADWKDTQLFMILSVPTAWLVKSSPSSCNISDNGIWGQSVIHRWCFETWPWATGPAEDKQSHDRAANTVVEWGQQRRGN